MGGKAPIRVRNNTTAGALTATETSQGYRCRGATRATVTSKVSAFSAGTLDVKPQIAPEDVAGSYKEINVPPDITEDIVLAQQAGNGVESVTFPLTAEFIRIVMTGASSPDMGLDVWLQLHFD